MIPDGAAAIRISIVEDDELTRHVLEDLIRSTAPLTLLAAYGDSESAIVGLTRDRPDVVLMDINLPTESGVECVRRLKPLLPKTQFLMLTICGESDKIFSALAAGATGYLLKTARRKELIAGIRQIHAGGSPMSGEIARKVVRSFGEAEEAAHNTDSLSAREQEVLGLLAQGFLYKEIAVTLQLQVPTVSTYVRRIYEKLQVHSRGQAAAKYFDSRPDRAAKVP